MNLGYSLLLSLKRLKHTNTVIKYAFNGRIHHIKL